VSRFLASFQPCPRHSVGTAWGLGGPEFQRHEAILCGFDPPDCSTATLAPPPIRFPSKSYGLLRLLSSRSLATSADGATSSNDAVFGRFASFGKGKQQTTSTWKGWVEMADIYKFSDRVVDVGERLADVADAVQGKGSRNGKGGARWLILPAVGAGLYALGTNSSFTRQAKNVMDQAKERASDLPEELMGLVQQATGVSGGSRKRTSTSRTGSQRRRKTGNQRRKTTSAAR
jgi:hypothetical protein